MASEKRLRATNKYILEVGLGDCYRTENPQLVTTEQDKPKCLQGSPKTDVTLEKHEVSYSHQVSCWLGLMLSTRA